MRVWMYTKGSLPRVRCNQQQQQQQQLVCCCCRCCCCLWVRVVSLLPRLLLGRVLHRLVVPVVGPRLAPLRSGRAVLGAERPRVPRLATVPRRVGEGVRLAVEVDAAGATAPERVRVFAILARIVTCRKDLFLSTPYVRADSRALRLGEEAIRLSAEVVRCRDGATEPVAHRGEAAEGREGLRVIPI